LIPEQVQALYETVQEQVPFAQFDANAAQQVVPVANIKDGEPWGCLDGKPFGGF
jgi:hypothetical protein